VRTIYEPRGKAREYSPLAVNFYNGCDHGCVYCYAPSLQFKSRADYLKVTPRAGLLEALEKAAKKYQGSQKQVLFNFMGDPYCQANDKYGLTREALKIMLKYRIPVSILTKGGVRVFRDIDIIGQFGDSIMVGQTITTLNPNTSWEWEPGAPTSLERIAALRGLKNAGVRTWASFEPVIDTCHALAAMERSLEAVDVYKVGKMNRYPTMTGKDDWPAFLNEVVTMLRGAGKQFYIKEDLRLAAPDVKLYGSEVIADDHCARPFSEGVL